MKIARVWTHILRREMRGGLRNAQTIWNVKEAVLVVIESDQGLVGIGEAWTSGHSAAPVAELVEDLGRLIIGRDIDAPRAVWLALDQTEITAAKGGAFRHALGAIDIALWDLSSKLSGQSLSRRLGPCRSRVPVYASGGLYGEDKTIDDLAAEMRSYVEHGFNAVKMKVGGGSEELDVARVKAVRDAIGPNTKLMVDGVWSYTPRTALHFAERIAIFDVSYFEAPVSANDVRGTRFVNLHGPIGVCGQDHGSGIDYYRTLLENDAVDIVLATPIACGGITECLEIGALTRAFHKQMTLHSASTAISLLAGIHMAAVLPAAVSVEFHQVHQLLFDHLPEGFLSIEDGCLRVPTLPGLGLSGLDSEGAIKTSVSN